MTTDYPGTLSGLSVLRKRSCPSIVVRPEWHGGEGVMMLDCCPVDHIVLLRSSAAAAAYTISAEEYVGYTGKRSTKVKDLANNVLAWGLY
jgi:hypothetical protein